jgi:hypothetical protein
MHAVLDEKSFYPSIYIIMTPALFHSLHQAFYLPPYSSQICKDGVYYWQIQSAGLFNQKPVPLFFRRGNMDSNLSMKDYVDDSQLLQVLSFFPIALIDLIRAYHRSPETYADLLVDPTHSSPKTSSIGKISWQSIQQNMNQTRLENISESLALEEALALENQGILQETNPWVKKPQIFTIIRQFIFEQAKIGLPTPVSHLILSYIETIFEKATPLIQYFYSRINPSHGGYPTFNYQVVQQEAASSNCGYWALFNVYRILFRITAGTADAFDKNQLSEKFKVFKSWVNQILGGPQSDISPLQLSQVLDSMTFLEGLQEMQAAADMPAYTIVNSLRVGEQKLQSGFTFGGCLEAIKLRFAINMYRLSLREKEQEGKTLHGFFVGDGLHWHVQWLALGYGPHRYGFIHMDSVSATYAQARSVTELHLVDILKHPIGYATNVASEVMPFLRKEITNLLSNHSRHHIKLQKQFLQVNYSILMKFFDTFEKFDFIKPHLPVRNLAKRLMAQSSKPPVQLSWFQSVSQTFENITSKFAFS